MKGQLIFFPTNPFRGLLSKQGLFSIEKKGTKNHPKVSVMDVSKLLRT